MFVKIYDLGDSDWGSIIHQTIDGRYFFMVGHRLHWTDRYGDTLQTRMFDQDVPLGNLLLETDDGGFLFANYTYSNLEESNAFLTKLNAAGNLEWFNGYGGNSYDYILDAVQTTDGGFLFTGTIGVAEPFYYDLWNVRTSEFGDIVWTKLLIGEEEDHSVGYAIEPSENGGYVVMGKWRGDWVLFNISDDGDSLSMKEFESPLPSFQTICVEPALDGGFIFALGSALGIFINPRLVLVKVDGQGQTQWAREYEELLSAPPAPFQLRPTMDGGYAVLGDSLGNGIWLAKFDAEGDLLWHRVYGGSYANDFVQTSDEGFIITGSIEKHTNHEDFDERDVVIIKTDHRGRTSEAVPRGRYVDPNPTAGIQPALNRGGNR